MQKTSQMIMIRKQLLEPAIGPTIGRIEKNFDDAFPKTKLPTFHIQHQSKMNKVVMDTRNIHY